MENNSDVMIQEETNQSQENNSQNVNMQKEKKKKKRKTARILVNLITTILFLVVVGDAIVGIINMQRINNKEEPIWYLSTKTTETDLKTVTEYHLGLYKIVKTDTAKETKTTLKPFFLAD